MKCIVTGANGMLGNALCPLLSEKGYEVFATDINISNINIELLDVRDFENVKKYISRVNPDIIFHLAAETDVDKCEIEVKHAYKTNVLGTENIVFNCMSYDIPLVYISTCSVFDGKKREPYNEFDIPNPISVYSKTKHKGEQIVSQLLNRFFIFRAGWMIGGGIKDKKFVAKIIELLKDKKELSVVNDKFGSPTFTNDFSRKIAQVIDTERYGLYHVTNKGVASRFDIACKIVEILNKNEVAVKPISSAAFPLPAPRPDSEASNNFKLQLLEMDDLPHWEKALRDYISKLIVQEN
ncbi:MAG: dTDP-4-dehydrorhamnose reductase [Candidatus Omnitrophota bacterium]